MPIEPRPSCPQQCLDQTLVRPQAQAQHACSNMNMKFCNSIIFISVTIVYSSNNNEVTECPSVNCNPSFAPPSKRPHAMMPMRSSSISLSPSNLNFSTKQRSSGMTCTAAHRLSDQRRLRLFKAFLPFSRRVGISLVWIILKPLSSFPLDAFSFQTFNLSPQ